MSIYYLFILAIFLINFVSLVFVYLDKVKSRNGTERSPEVAYFLYASLFGSLGIFLGIFAFRHKTKKIYLPLGVGFILIQQIVLVYLLFKVI